jgi:hypothetical protein
LEGSDAASMSRMYFDGDLSNCKSKSRKEGKQTSSLLMTCYDGAGDAYLQEWVFTLDGENGLRWETIVKYNANTDTTVYTYQRIENSEEVPDAAAEEENCSEQSGVCMQAVGNVDDPAPAAASKSEPKSSTLKSDKVEKTDLCTEDPNNILCKKLVGGGMGGECDGTTTENGCLLSDEYKKTLKSIGGKDENSKVRHFTLEKQK